MSPSTLRSAGLAGLFLIAAAVPAAAQAAASQGTPARYGPRADTLRYETVNPFRMYWIVAGDTIGEPRRMRSLEAHEWRGTAAEPLVIVLHTALGFDRATKLDTVSVHADGRVKQINGEDPDVNARVDFLTRLPEGPLAVGAEWADTLTQLDAAGDDPTWFTVLRESRVTRLVDSLGGKLAEIESDGRVQFRLSIPPNEETKHPTWIEVSGPMTERAFFDVTGNRLILREWSMDLRGSGVAAQSTDTVPAGLTSSSTMTLAGGTPRYRLLTRALPGADSSATIVPDEEMLSLHTVSRSPTSLVSAFVGPDGGIGISTLRVQGAVPTGFESEWTDDDLGHVTYRATVKGKDVTLERTGQEPLKTKVPEARSFWAIADHLKNDLLVPMLMAVPRDSQPHKVAILRPYEGEWDLGVATVKVQNGLVLVALELEDHDADVFIIGPEGDMLFVRTEGDPVTVRVPLNAPRLKRLETAFATQPPTGAPRER